MEQRSGEGTPISGRSKRATSRHAAARAKRKRLHVAGVCAIIAVLLLSAFLVQGAIGWRDGALPKNGAPPQNQAGSRHLGTIQLSAEGDKCRRLLLDNKTGQVIGGKAVACGGNADVPFDPKEALKRRYSGGRLDAIRDSFSGRGPNTP
jgi:hypothetical protein